MSQGQRWNRRQALRRACAAASGLLAAPLVVKANVLGLADSVAPSERITLGFIGVGMMGRGHVHHLLEYAQTQILAVCDVDRWRRDDAKNTVEQGYASQAASGQYKGCSAYNDLRDLLARPDIDAVVIATGDRWHALATILAAKAGKDVYCEKPVSLTICENLAMMEHIDRYGRIFQAGLQQRSTPEFMRACELVQKGRIGQVRNVYVTSPGTCYDVNFAPEPVPDTLDWDLWLGPAPWRPFNRVFHHVGPPKFVVPWHVCPDFGGGNLTSNAVHAFDVVQWGLGMDESGPVEITPPETGKVPLLTYKYANDTLLQVTPRLDPSHHTIPPGWDANTPIQVFGALFVGDSGWIHVGRQGFLEAYPREILAETPASTEPDRPVTNHHLNWLSCIRTRERSACSVSAGCRSTIVAQLGCIAHWTQRSLQWNPEKFEFVGDVEANLMRQRTMREPWTV
jgi:predicted dehydrogenase